MVAKFFCFFFLNFLKLFMNTVQIQRSECPLCKFNMIMANTLYFNIYFVGSSVYFVMLAYTKYLQMTN